MRGTASSSITFSAPAKVNLTLAVRGCRADGFHELESWITPVTLFDDLILTPADVLSLRVEAGEEGFDVPPEGETNLVWRAAELLAAAAGRSPNVAIRLVKRIPMEAGLGGGSSDAASTLLGLNALWGLQWTFDELAPIAESLGSDVPVFLLETSAIVRGRGEAVEPLAECWEGWFSLVVPDFGLSTASVFKRWNKTDTPPAVARPVPWKSMPCTAAQLSRRLFNDLQEPAFRVEPRLRVMAAALSAIEGPGVHMTGSGSGLFAVFDANEAAEAWRERAIAAAGGPVRTWVVRSMPRVFSTRGGVRNDNDEIDNRLNDGSPCRNGVGAVGFRRDDSATTRSELNG